MGFYIMNKPTHSPKLVVIETSTMKLTQYEGKKKGDSVIMNTNETPLNYIKESIEQFRLEEEQPKDNTGNNE